MKMSVPYRKTRYRALATKPPCLVRSEFCRGRPFLGPVDICFSGNQHWLPPILHPLDRPSVRVGSQLMDDSRINELFPPGNNQIVCDRENTCHAIRINICGVFIGFGIYIALESHMAAFDDDVDRLK